MITAVSTGTTAFAGWTTTGPVDRAALAVGWADFERQFGGLHSQSPLSYAVAHFFGNGGSRAFVARIIDQSDPSVPLMPGDERFAAALFPEDRSGGLFLLDGVDLFDIVCIPGLTSPAAVAAVQAYCHARRVFLIADCERGATVASLQGESAPAAALTGEHAMNCAFYFPWIVVADPLQGNQPAQVPPCGFIAGIYARTDAARGVWKAPAGVDARLVGAAGTAVPLTGDQMATLNPKAINCIRTLPQQGIVAWGARTLHGDDRRGSDWKYIPVRRTALFIEESIRRGLSWTAAEPNGAPLWTRIRTEIGDFLHGLLRQGAFAGRTPREAFFVKCDAETTTQDDIDRGIVNALVGFAPLKPAEFVIIRLDQVRRPGT